MIYLCEIIGSHLGCLWQNLGKCIDILISKVEEAFRSFCYRD